MNTVELEIDSLAYQGYGVGRHEGRVWFVPFTAPGDRIRARAVKEKTNLVFGKAEEILRPAQDRMVPPCPFFGDCGGCDWQFLPYKKQLEIKEVILKETLSRGKCAWSGDIRVHPSPQEWNYRNRIQMRLSPSGQPGFYRRESRTITPVDSCLLAREELNGKLKELLVNPEKLPPGGFELRSSLSGTADLVPLSGKEDLPHDFSQVNNRVNEILRREIRENLVLLTSNRRDLSILDLFCGDGNLSLPLADLAKRIRGWDISASGVSEGNRKASEFLNGDILYTARSLEGDGKSIREEARRADVLILDPPRRGLKGLEGFISNLGVPRILYVSCSPPTLARDLNHLNKKGWETKNIVLLDMFPQTYHMETLAVLERKPRTAEL